ncbi:MAG: M23 family metallopeptidase [Chloroflexota bacterium]|nr:M23 family metallopeptidase [Chloroflexota bacterium]
MPAADGLLYTVLEPGLSAARDQWGLAVGRTLLIPLSSARFGGITVCTKHDGGFESCACHAAATLVDTGDTVRRGERIAIVGMSGLANGPHVHWEVKRGGVLVNPLLY